MLSMDSKKFRPFLVIILVAFFALFALWLRLLPMLSMGNTDFLSMVSMDDPLYNLRQVELILANFPGYGWFEPMTNYPFGTRIYWGPLFPAIIAACCLITGAVTRPETIGVGLLVPPFMAAAIVVLMYFAGRAFGDWKTGILASGFTAIVSGQFFTVSWYGYIDHHIAEVLFSTLFCLAYCYAILSEKDTPIDLKNPGTYKKTLVLSIFAGIAYLLGLFVMPTMILFAMIVGIFTVIQCIIDFYRHRSSAYILIINGTVFLVAITGLLLFGLNNPGIDLSTYSIGHVYAYLGLIFGTVVLYLLARALHGRQTWYYPAFLVGSAGIFAVILFVLAPQLYNLLIGSLFAFFGQQAITETVLEARGWSLDHAWFSFNYGLILFAGGALVMLYNNWRDEHPHQVFALVWSLVMFFSTWQHVRYEYYLAINIALLSAFCVGFVFERGWVQIRHRTAGISCLQGSPEHKNREDEHMPRKKLQKADRKKIARSPAQGYLFIVLFVLAALICALFALTSASYSYTNASDNAGQMNPDWRESLEWLGNNTPETGVNYLTIYDPVTFDYPPESYGIMSWWDYGHMITYISKRMPNANPFQQGVSGDSGAAAYFVSTSEDLTNTILDKLGTRYVITDIEMDTGKFPAMATWYNSSFAADPYMKTLLVPGAADPNRLEPRLLNTEQYYLTMVSRLHNFDGSMTPATTVYYVEYADPAVYGVSLPVVTNAETMNATDAMNRADQFNLNPSAGHHAMALSTSLVNPVGDIPALRHYRLIHESPSNVFDAATPDVKYVKVFEYVKGARIRGNGIIELPLVSNTGRIFTYRQESINGEFIVPFSTTGNPYDVHATGKYRISGTTLQFDVPEQAVMLGSYVN